MLDFCLNKFISMAQSHSVIIVHLVFRIRNGSPVIKDQDLPNVFAFMAQLAERGGCNVIKIGGVGDHVHLLLRLPRTQSIAQTAEGVKSNSSRMIRRLRPYYHNFAWQSGYGVFGVGYDHIPHVKSFIEHQPNRHASISYAEEYSNILRLCDEPYFPIGTDVDSLMRKMKASEPTDIEKPHCVVTIHLVFHIGLHSPVIREEEMPSIFSVLSEAITGAECKTLAVGGINNHVHLLFRLPRTRSIADACEFIKSFSSRKISMSDPYYETFAWQKGYGAFSVSYDNVPKVMTYIANQKEHHAIRPYRNEYISLLEQHSESYDNSNINSF